MPWQAEVVDPCHSTTSECQEIKLAVVRSFLLTDIAMKHFSYLRMPRMLELMW